MSDTPPPLTIEQQADLVEGIAERCCMLDGSIAGEAYLTLKPFDVEHLIALANRLRRMAPHEAAIKRVVMGK